MTETFVEPDECPVATRRIGYPATVLPIAIPYLEETHALLHS
ncbi:hypothetical protein Pd630_LPD01824 [Rhodococcus opacus PD630]|nr:hypothetical protein Pd630_LPD01824 [Rhodococcus opacus PD630]